MISGFLQKWTKLGNSLNTIFEICDIKASSFLKSIIPLTLLISFIDFLSISFLVPAITVFSGGSFGSYDLKSDTIISISIALALSFLFLKILILPLLVRLYMRRVLNLRRDISTGMVRLLVGSGNKDGFAEVVHSGINEINVVINRILIPLIDLSIELLVMIFISTSLIILDPKVGTSALICAIFGFWLIVRLTFSKLGQAGSGRAHWERVRIKKAKDYFFIFWQARMTGADETFLEKYRGSTQNSNNANLELHTFRALSKSLIESLFLCTVVGGIGYLYFFNPQLNITKALGIVAVVRLMPSVTRLMYSGQSIKFGYQTLLNIVSLSLRLKDSHDDLHQKPNTKLISNSDLAKENFEQNQSIVMRAENFAINNGETELYSGLNFELEIAGKTLVKGPSGIGKSSFFNSLTGRNTSAPQAVQIIIDGKTSVDNSYQHIALVEQDPYLFEGSLIENVILGAEFNKQIFDSCLRAANVVDFIELTQAENLEVSDLGANFSGGERARICVARALYQKKPILLLDETLASVPLNQAVSIMDSALKLQWVNSVIVVWHNLDTKKSLFDREISVGKDFKIT